MSIIHYLLDTEGLTTLIIAGAILLILFAWLLRAIVLFAEPPGIHQHELIHCPMCGRLINLDWYTARGACCDCDDELHALERPRLSDLNPHILQRSNPLPTPVSPERTRNLLQSSTDAAVCAGRRPAPGYNH